MFCRVDPVGLFLDRVAMREVSRQERLRMRANRPEMTRGREHSILFALLKGLVWTALKKASEDRHTPATFLLGRSRKLQELD
jgi:hypothetical protein